VVPLEVHLPVVDYAKPFQNVFDEFAYHMMWATDTPFRTGLKRYVRHNYELHLPDE